MSEKEKIKRKDVHCPRDKALLQLSEVGEAHLDVCLKCGGQFFDTGEMFKAFGVKADPSYWDREETGGSVKESTLHCPRCDSHMLGQDISYKETHVEIDRCGHCGGIWLDKGEVDTVMKIGDLLQPLFDEQKAKAAAELEKMGTPDFSPPGLISRFLRMFKKG
jgi:Zn-finger nucleic acid-binding protein